MVTKQRSGTLSLLQRVKLTTGSERFQGSSARATTREDATTVEERRLCGDNVYCDGPLRKRHAGEQDLDEQDLDLLMPVKENQGQKTPQLQTGSFPRL